jgi:hypothetical protein
MGVPIVYIVQEQPTALLFVFSAVCLIICFSILLLMFVPKIMAIHQNEEESSNIGISTTNSFVSQPTNGGSTRMSMAGGLIASQKKVNNKRSNDLDPSRASEPSIAEEGPTGYTEQKSSANRDSSASEPS